MAIQNINLGTAPNGVGGDTLRSTATKINENFSNATHAAGRLLGAASGQVPLAQQTFKAAFKNTDAATQPLDLNDYEIGSRILLSNTDNVLNAPPSVFGTGVLWIIETIGNHPTADTRRTQTAVNYSTGAKVVRSLTVTWSNWTSISTNLSNYNMTSTDAPNIVVDTKGELKRSTTTYKSYGLGTESIAIPYEGTGRFMKSVTHDYKSGFYSAYGALDAPKVIGLRWQMVYLRDTADSGVLLAASTDSRDKGLYLSQKLGGVYGEWIQVYTTGNTTKDSNGFIKAASPIVKVHADKVVLNDEAEQQNVTFKKNGIGDYTITTESGLSTDGWYIELPKDMNGNPKVAVTLSEVEGVITLKSYKRIFSMETFTFEPDLDNPLDIPTDRWIDIRLNEIPVEQPEMPLEPTEGTNTPVAEAKAPSEPVEPYSEV